MIDYHTHTKLCKHAEGEMYEYIDMGIGRGLKEIGISCHNPMPGGFDQEHRMSRQEFDEIYLPAVAGLKEKYNGKIIIKLGLEADFFPGTEKYVEDFLKRYDFDFVIGSVHFLGSWNKLELTPVFRFLNNVDEDLYVDYYKSVEQMAKSGLFDIVGHFDLVKNNSLKPESDASRIEKAMRDALSGIKNNNLCIEINSSGLRKKVGEIYPAEELIPIIREYDISLTSGSDAHKPEHVAGGFDLVHNLIKKFNSNKVSVFSKRKRTEVTVQ